MQEMGEIHSFLSLFRLAKPVLRPNLQPHRHQAQHKIPNSRYHTNPVQWPTDNSGIIPHLAGSKDDAHGCQGDAGKHGNYEASVPIIESVNGEGCPAPQQASAGAHGVRF